jgi:diguanylate cyclase (GGDEF)-like protein
MRSVRLIVRVLIYLISPSLCLSAQAKVNVHELFLDGKSINAYCHAIVQDNSGFLWIATDNGLKRYDGYQLTGFKQHSNAPTAIESNTPSLLLDTDGSLWIGGTKLMNYIPEEDKFTTYDVSDNTFIWAIFRDANDILWIGGEGFGLRGIDLSSGVIVYQLFTAPQQLFINHIVRHGQTSSVWIASGNELYLFDTLSLEIEKYPWSGGGILDLMETRDGRVWVATSDGVWKLEPLTGKYTHYSAQPGISGAIQSKVNQSLFEDSKGQIWIGSDKLGVYKYLPDSDSFLNISASIDEDNRFPPGAVSDIFEDKDGSLWFTVAHFGVFRISEHLEKFSTLIHNANSAQSLGFNNVTDLHQDESGKIWIATDGGGLDRYDPETGDFIHFRHDENDPKSIGSDSILAIAQNTANSIWFGTWGAGISKLDLSKMTFDNINPDKEVNENIGLADINIYSIVVDDRDRLLLSVWNSGLQILDTSSGRFQMFVPGGIGQESGISNVAINDIEPAGDDRYWIGGQRGLELFDAQSETFESIPLTNSGSILGLYLARTGLLWIATENGLLSYDPIKQASNNHPITDEFVTSIEGDRQGFLWLGTRNGLIRFNPATEKLQTFDKFDGLAGNQFNRNSHLLSRDGLMYFGGADGLSVFNPSHIPLNEADPKVQITSFELFQKRINLHKSEFLTQTLIQLEELELPHSQNHLAFEFTAMNFISPMKNRYRYRLLGLEQDWIDVDSNRRRASYTNLDPGRYTFEVIAANNDGIWSLHPRRIEIHILHPWWQTWWARMLFAGLAGGLIYGFIRSRLYHNQQRQAELQSLVEEKTTELASANAAVLQLNMELEQRVEKRTIELSIKEKERRAAEAKLFHMAFHDPLTGLPNRPWLLQKLEQYISLANHQQGGFALMFLDGDRFKKVNDTHGHTLGDNLLIAAAKRLVTTLPSNCHAVRLGGDEFTVLIQNPGSQEELMKIVNQIIQAFDQPFRLDQLKIFFRVSIGIVSCQSQYSKPEEVLRDADIAMYKAKEKGRGCFQMFDMQMRDQKIEISALETDLTMAMDKGQFFVVYQPIIALDTGQLVSFETLLRWQHPRQGLIPPDRFIPLAEENGLIFDIGIWVIRQACTQLRAWHDLMGETNLPSIAVNLSALQLNQPDLIERIDVILAETQIQGKHLKLEITETALMEYTEEVNTLLDCLRKRSIELAIDDFGTGYSSLYYLDKLPVQVLKIDRSFVDSLINREEEHEGAQEIVKATISLAHSLNIKVVAEGIEVQEQWDFLLANQCDFGQGYFIDRPLTIAAATNLIKQSLKRS